MKITSKLFASLTDYLPAQARYTNVLEPDIAPEASISQIIEPYGLPSKLVLINGNYIAPEKRLTQTLVEGDLQPSGLVHRFLVCNPV